MRKYFKNRKNFYLTFKLKTNLKRNSFFFIKKNELLFKFVLFLLKKKSKKNLKKKWFRFFFFLKKNYFLTKKNRNSRMGKGKSGKGLKHNSKKKKKKKSKTPTESTILEEDGESVTEDGSVRSILTRDEEDPSEAFVRALTGSVLSCSDNEDEHSSTKPTVREAQQHLGDMLDDILFSPRCSTPCSLGSNSVGKMRVDEGGSEEEESQNKINSEEAEICADEECGDVEVDPAETTGLLTGDSVSYSANNLRPSIFTTISQQQSREEDVVVEDEKEDLEDDNNLDPKEFSAILEKDQ